MFWQSLKNVNFFIFNTFSRFSQTTTLRPLFKFYPMLWYCLQRINSFDGLHCGLILDFQFFEANGSETSVDVRSMQSLNRTKRSASRSFRKTAALRRALVSIYNIIRYLLLHCVVLVDWTVQKKILRQISSKTFITCAALSTDSFNKNSNYRNSKNAKQEPCFNFLCQVGFYQAYTSVREGRAIISRETEQI